jgi:hypothetical protein
MNLARPAITGGQISEGGRASIGEIGLEMSIGPKAERNEFPTIRTGIRPFKACLSIIRKCLDTLRYPQHPHDGICVEARVELAKHSF